MKKISYHGQWQWYRLVIAHLCAVLLLLSPFVPPIADLWHIVNTSCFACCNGLLRDSDLQQAFWSCVNYKGVDWISDVVFFGLFYLLVRLSSPALRMQKVAECIFCTLFIGATILLLNCSRSFFYPIHPSPSLVMPDPVRLSLYAKVKDASSKSFPSDHGTTALMFGAFYMVLAPRRYQWAGWVYSVATLCLPRLVSGAHWLSDILAGSGSLTILLLSWAYYTPFAAKVTARIEAILERYRQRRRSLDNLDL